MYLHKTIIGNGPDMLLLHGWGSNSAIWTPVIDTLAKNYRITLIDLPGHGLSRFAGEPFALADVVDAIAQHIDASSIVIGWSLGGLLAMQLAITFPAKVKRLITVASSPKFLQAESWPGLTDALLEQFAQQLRENHEKTLERFLLLQFYGLKGGKEHFLDVKNSVLAAQQPDPAALKNCLTILAESDLRSRLASIKIPNLHIYGYLDAIVPRSITLAIKPYLNNADIIILPKASHIPFLSHPDEFHKCVNAFLGDTIAAV